MSPWRVIPWLLSLAIFFANVCCLMHTAPAATAAQAKKIHSCCHKTVASEHKPSPSQSKSSDDCCKRADVKILSEPATQHSVFATHWTTTIDAAFIAQALVPTSTFAIDSHAPPASADVLQQSCTLIL